MSASTSTSHKPTVSSVIPTASKPLPTIQELLSKGARVILMSHLGKIKWKEPDPEKIEAMKKANDMAPVAKALAELPK